MIVNGVCAGCGNEAKIQRGDLYEYAASHMDQRNGSACTGTFLSTQDLGSVVTVGICYAGCGAQNGPYEKSGIKEDMPLRFVCLLCG